MNVARVVASTLPQVGLLWDCSPDATEVALSPDRFADKVPIKIHLLEGYSILSLGSQLA